MSEFRNEQEKLANEVLRAGWSDNWRRYVHLGFGNHYCDDDFVHPFKDTLAEIAKMDSYESCIGVVASIDFKAFGPSHNQWIAALARGNVDPLLELVDAGSISDTSEDGMVDFLTTLGLVFGSDPFFLSYDTGNLCDGSYRRLRNWLRTRVMQNTIIGAGIVDENGWIDNYDCDACIKEPGIREILGWFKTTSCDGGREEIPWIDCIYSTQSYLRRFLRFYLDAVFPNWIDRRQADLELLFVGKDIASLSKDQRKALDDVWILQNFEYFFSPEAVDKADNLLGNCGIKSCLHQFDVLALSTHTLGNYMPCPGKLYNYYKGNYFGPYNDRLDLLLSDRSPEARVSYYQNEISRGELCRSIFLGAFHKYRRTDVYGSYDQPAQAKGMPYQPPHKNKFQQEDIPKLVNYLQWVNQSILWRGAMLAQVLLPPSFHKEKRQEYWENMRLRGIPFRTDDNLIWGLKKDNREHCYYSTLENTSGAFCNAELVYPFHYELDGKDCYAEHSELTSVLIALLKDPEGFSIPDDCIVFYSSQELEFIKRFQAALLEKLEESSAGE